MFEDILSKDTSDTADLLGITIKFALVAEPRESATANERQAAVVVAAATTAVVPLSSNPAAVDVLSSAVDTGTYVIPQAQTTCDLLLKRIALFIDIVTGIAEVFGARRLDFLRPECHTGSPVCVPGLVCYFSCQQGLLVARYPCYY